MTQTIKGHLSTEQLILLKVYKKDEPVTIEELQKELDIPRTSLVEHLKLLERDGLLIKDKDSRTIIYKSVPEIANKIREALEKLNSAYVYALGYIQQRRLKELKELE